jgi:acetolactate synthase-1/3 small subunit
VSESPATQAVKHHVLSVLVENKAGVLARVSGLFARRGFNILSLAVAPTPDERLSRITMTVDVESAPLDQVTKQLFKLINVLEIREIDPAQLDGFEDRLRAFTNFDS